MHSQCRSCAVSFDTTPRSYHIFETMNLAGKFKRCSALAIDACDSYPTCICEKCYQKVEDIWEYQEMCRKSIHKFNEMLELVKSRCLNAKTEVTTPENTSNDNIQVASSDVGDSPLDVLDNTSKTNVHADQSRRLKKCCRNEKACCKQETTQRHDDVLATGAQKSSQPTAVEDYNDGTRKCKAKPNDNTSSISEFDQSSVEDLDLLQVPFKCNICPKQFATQHRLVAHQRKHKGLLPYVCSLQSCAISFNRWHNYQAHLRQHTDSNELFKCDISNCQRVYKNKSALNVHKRKYHQCGPELKSHMCEICGKVFKSSAVLNDHRFTHVEKSQLPYECDEQGCTKRFSKKEKLKIHKMRHAGIKNFICPHCGMRKTTRNELKIHINYHTLERTWPCRFCDKVCNSAGNLKMHVRNIHERAKDFACRYCDRMFAKADTKKYHEMTHTGEKPHACDECGRRFLQPAALRKHRKIHAKTVGLKIGAAQVDRANETVYGGSDEKLN